MLRRKSKRALPGSEDAGEDDSGQESRLQSAREAAIALLARRDFASGELQKKLEARGYDASTAAALIAELRRENVLDDARYASNYVAYHSARGQGPIRITADLKALGIGADFIDAALDGGPDWRVLAQQARARKFGPEAPQEWREKTRQARFLQYRGFSSDHIRFALGTDFDPD